MEFAILIGVVYTMAYQFGRNSVEEEKENQWDDYLDYDKYH